LTIRYGIRWDGRGRPKLARAVAPGLAALALVVLPAPARAQDAGDAAAAASMTRIVGGAGIARGTSGGAPDAAGGSGGAPDTALGGSGGTPGAADGSGIDVALIDSGVVPVGGLAEPGRVIHGPDFSSERDDAQLATLDTFGHGTHLAGLIAGRDPVTGFAGVAPGARLVSVKVAGADGETRLARILAALDWVLRNRNAGDLNIRVVNLSLGVEDRRGYYDDVLAWAVERLWEDGIAVVAAAGNHGSGARRLDIPAADPFVIAAGATDTFDTADPADDRVADFSSRSALRPPDVVAPGTHMVSLRVPGSALDEEYPGARVGDRYFRGSGTSHAAAVVTGLAARLLSASPELTPDQLKALLVAGAVDLPDPRRADGAGRVDLERSLAAPVPSVEQARQRWIPAFPRSRALRRALQDRAEIGSGAVWAGRRWSGRRWSGRRWSGASWIVSAD
jgi:serine protease AprX